MGERGDRTGGPARHDWWRTAGRMWRRPVVVLPLALVLLVGDLWLGGRVVLESLSRRLAASASWRGRQLGVEVVDLGYAGTDLSALLEASWRDLSACVRPVGETGPAGAWRRLRAARLAVAPRGLTEVRLIGEGIDLEMAHGPHDAPADLRFRIERFILSRVPIDLLAPAETLRRVARELLALARQGRTTRDLELDGRLEFPLRGVPRTARISVMRQVGASLIVMDRDDLRGLAAQLETRLTEAEVALVADHPLRVPRLLRIKTRAEETARRAHAEDPGLPEDAYRHVLWSYLLTRTFGASFAEQVTDAHEKGETGNTAAERAMDLHNNEVGRRWAAARVPQEAIAARVRTDPAVRRTP